MSTNILTEAQVEQRNFMVRVYGWMSLALLVTAFVAMFTASSPVLLGLIFSSRFVFYGLLLAELGLVFYLSANIDKMTASGAKVGFFGYSVLNGITLASIFLVYTGASIASTFVVTAGVFGIMSLWGYLTKTDLTGLGNFCLMGLIGIVLASIVNLFLHNETVYWVTTYIGIIVFTGLTAYDTQKIKNMNVLGNEGTEADTKEAIMGALILYLDFINLFLKLLAVMGKKK